MLTVCPYSAFITPRGMISHDDLAARIVAREGTKLSILLPII
jgi:hypothetical protein